eukprot:scaffold106502_cov63-Phaeocystis_antarctica.AAC.1
MTAEASGDLEDHRRVHVGNCGIRPGPFLRELRDRQPLLSCAPSLVPVGPPCTRHWRAREAKLGAEDVRVHLSELALAQRAARASRQRAVC